MFNKSLQPHFGASRLRWTVFALRFCEIRCANFYHKITTQKLPLNSALRGQEIKNLQLRLVFEKQKLNS
jgi:hypothetical protein